MPKRRASRASLSAGTPPSRSRRRCEDDVHYFSVFDFSIGKRRAQRFSLFFTHALSLLFSDLSLSSLLFSCSLSSLSFARTKLSASAPSRSTSPASRYCERGRRPWPRPSRRPRPPRRRARRPTPGGTSPCWWTSPCRRSTSSGSPRPCSSGGDATPRCSPRWPRRPRRSLRRPSGRRRPRSRPRPRQRPRATSCPLRRARRGRGRPAGEKFGLVVHLGMRVPCCSFFDALAPESKSLRRKT